MSSFCGGTSFVSMPKNDILSGPLFHQLHQKRWYLAPHAIKVLEDSAESKDPSTTAKTAVANIFENRPFGSGKYTIAVGLALPQTATSVALVARVAVGNFHSSDSISCTTTLLGRTGKGVPCKVDIVSQENGMASLNLSVPILRGCAVAHVQIVQ